VGGQAAEHERPLGEDFQLFELGDVVEASACEAFEVGRGERREGRTGEEESCWGAGPKSSATRPPRA